MCIRDSYTAVATSDSPLGDFVNSKELLTKEDFGSNCIDQFYYEEDNKKYMFVGSFNGIYVTELTDDGLSVKRNENGTPTLKKQVCGKAFEGTNIYKKNGYYYLFASINNCCDGERSRYKVVVGRSQAVSYTHLISLSIGVDSLATISQPLVDYPIRKNPVVFYGTSILQGGCASRPGMAHTNIISVSYTHLDVYKRQTEYRY